MEKPRSELTLSLFTFMHWRRKWQPTPVFLPGESQGQRSLLGCHLWGCAELDTTDTTQQQPLYNIDQIKKGWNVKSVFIQTNLRLEWTSESLESLQEFLTGSEMLQLARGPHFEIHCLIYTVHLDIASWSHDFPAICFPCSDTFLLLPHDVAVKE